MAENKQERPKTCKQNRRSTELNNALAELLKQGQNVFSIAVEEVCATLPSRDDIIANLKGLANRLSGTLDKFSKSLEQASAKAEPAIQELAKNASKEYEKQAQRLHEEEAFQSVLDGMQRIRSAMVESLRETNAVVEKLRPEADKAAQQVKEVMQDMLKELNTLGDELAKEIEKNKNK